MEARIAAFVSRHWNLPEARTHLDVQPLGGGLESRVARVRIIGRGPDGSVRSGLIVKELRTGFERETEVYEWLWGSLSRPPAVRVLGHERVGGATYLYLEDARPLSRWPWSDMALSGEVCRALARFHDSPRLSSERISWDYESELARSAEATLDIAASAAGSRAGWRWRRPGDLRRVVAALPAIRMRLLRNRTTVIHGDMHPGNVIVRRGTRDTQVVLIDWARARLGSPLEDIASWLHSLGCWEPQARRRHDTLMRAYLDARTVPRPFDSELRVDYWLASASNGLSGAIRYHISVLADQRAAPRTRQHSCRALVEWERVLRRAAALLSTSLDR